MNLSIPDTSSYKYRRDPKTSQQKFKEIISTAPKNSEWTAFTDLFLYQGFWHTTKFLEGIILAQEEFNPQPNDTILCSAPRTGTTWLKALCHVIMNRAHLNDAKNPLLDTLSHECVPYIEVDLFQHKAIQYPELALLATHVPYTSLPKSILESDCKLVYICRDPKDVFISLWHFIGNVKENEQFSMEKAFELFCQGVSPFGPYWDHVLGYWQASLQSPDKIMFLKYENLKMDTSFYVKKLAKFMGCPFSLSEEQDGMVEKIVEFCSIGKMSSLEVNKCGEYAMFASLSIKNSRYFRKGEVGDWKNYLTKEMEERVDQITDNKLKGSGFCFC